MRNKWKTVFRSAVSGRFVKAEFAKSTSEQLSKRNKKIDRTYFIILPWLEGGMYQHQLGFRTTWICFLTFVPATDFN